VTAMYTCKYFKIEELVSKQVYEYFSRRYGANFCWKFFQEQILKDLDAIREYHGHSITINNWKFGGSLNQCGLRSNVDPLVDLHSKDNIKLFNDIQTLHDKGILKVFRRLESRQSTKDGWVHVDGMQTANNKLEIFLA